MREWGIGNTALDNYALYEKVILPFLFWEIKKKKKKRGRGKTKLNVWENVWDLAFKIVRIAVIVV